MTDSPKEKGKRVTIEWSGKETDALDIIATREPFATLGSSRRAIVRYLVLMAAQEVEEKAATRGDIEELIRTVRSTAPAARASAPAPERPAKLSKAQRQESLAEEKIEEGEGICMALGGTVNGLMCQFKKYEVMATGRPVSFDTSEPLAVLGQSHLATQFDPSREAYDKAVAGWKDNE